MFKYIKNFTERKKIIGTFEVKETAKGYNFNLKAGNGEVICTSQVYKSMESCKHGIESVEKNVNNTKIKVIEK